MNNPGLQGIYKLLFETIGEGIIIVNHLGKILIANPRACEMFGYEENEITQLKVEALIPQTYRDQHVNHRKQYHEMPKKRRMGANMNLKAARKDRSEFDVEISLNYFSERNEFYVVALITDITERVRQQNEIQELNTTLERKVEDRTRQVLESQKLYSAIARNFPNGTINVFDKDLRYVFVEGLELQELGIKKENLIGTHYLERINQEVRPTIEKELEEVFKGKWKDFELNLLNQTYRINAVPLSDEPGQIDKILVVEENITAQKLIEQQREAALTKEKQLNEMKSRFVSMASHEFRTPLSTILSSVSLIEKYIEKNDINKTEKHIKRVKGAVAGLTEILNDFLSVEKLESNTNPVERSWFDIRNFIQDLKEEMDTICKEGQQIETQFEGGPFELYNDRKILKNVLYNLISNAIKYSNEGDRITVKTEVSEKHLILLVEDQGIGIPKEDRTELFGRFFRAQNATNIKGTGLGLNIVKKYVEMLNGEITFESRLNQGTTFKITLPIIEPDE